MRYTKTENGLTSAQDTPKIKNYACAEDVCQALADGCFTTGEVFSVPVVNGIFEDMASDIAEIKSYVPNSTSISNQLTNVSQVQGMIENGATAFTDCWTRLTNVECCANTNASSISQIAAVIPESASSINKLVDATTLSGVTDRVTNLEGCAGLTCVGTVTCATTCDATPITPDANGTLDLSPLALACDLTETNSSLSSLSTTVGTHTTCISCIEHDVDVNATCISGVESSVTALQGCPGLNCTGTLVSSDLTTLNSCASTHTTCIGCFENRISALERCAGLDCTGTLTAACFSLSGTTLTITI